MINIAICDDDVPMTAAIEEMLYKISSEQNIPTNCEVFFDGSTLIKNIQIGAYYDLIYLDVEMQTMGGIRAAEIIRDMEIPALIIYVTSHEECWQELFGTEPFRFLSKPINEEKFYAFYMAAYKRLQRRTEYFSFTYNKSYMKVPLNSIFYFESSNRVVYIHMSKMGKVENNKFYGKLNDVEEQLSSGNNRFIRIHQSYLVNFDYIKSMNFVDVCMADSTILQISEDRQKDVRTQFCTMARFEVQNDG